MSDSDRRTPTQHSAPSTQHLPSDEARRLLDYLRRYAPRPGLSRPDRVIAKAIGVDERAVIDLADELLDAGHVVIARTSHPAGRWLLQPGALPEEWSEARSYVDSLKSRAVKILARAKRAAAALERMEQSRSTDSQGQQRMFPDGPSPRSWAAR